MVADSTLPRQFRGQLSRERRHEDYTLCDNDLDDLCPLDNGDHVARSKLDIGDLDDLPLELLCEIFAQLDILSLTTFRRVNRRAMQVVNAIPQYRTIIKHGKTALQGILCIEVGAHVTCNDLFSALQERKCDNCGDLAGFIYLPTCSRVCSPCFTEDKKYFPLRHTEAVREFGVKKRIFNSVPTMKTIPGYFGPSYSDMRKSRMVLMDAEAARRAGAAFHGSDAAMKQNVAKVKADRLEEYGKQWDKSIKIGIYHGPLVPKNLPPDKVQDRYASDPRRYMAIVRAPWVDPATHSEEWGYYCVGCEWWSHDNRPSERDRSEHGSRLYTLESFAEHVKEHGPVVDRFHKGDRLS